MSFKTPLALLIAVALSLGGSGCTGGGDSMSGPQLLPFLFDITNIWSEEGNPSHEFNMVPTSQPSNTSGTFEGDETRDLPSGGQENSTLTGSFNLRNITFTIERSGGAITFSGMIVNENRIEVASSSESLVIVR